MHISPRLARPRTFNRLWSWADRTVQSAHCNTPRLRNFARRRRGQGFKFSALPAAVFTILARTFPLAASTAVIVSPVLS